MKTQPLALFLALGLFASAATAASVSLPELTLTDGRTLRDVSVKSYDAATGKFHLVADGTAQLLPAKLLSPALSADLQKKVSSAGRSVNIVKTTEPSETERARILSHRASAAERHAHELTQPIVVPAPPVPASNPAPVVYPYYPLRPTYYSGYGSNYYHWKNCVEKRRDEDYRRRTTPTTVTPPPPLNTLPSGPVNVGLNSTR